MSKRRSGSKGGGRSRGRSGSRGGSIRIGGRRGRGRYRMYRSGRYYDEYYYIDVAKATEYTRRHKLKYASQSYMGRTLPGHSAQPSFEDVIPDPIEEYPTPIPEAPTESTRRHHRAFEESNRVRSKMLKYSEIMIKHDREESIEAYNDDLFKIIKSTTPWIIEVFQTRSGLVFNYSVGSDYETIRGAGVNFTSKNGIMLVAVLFHEMPFSFDLRITEKKHPKSTFYGDNHLIQSPVPDAVNKLFADKSVKSALDKNLPSIKRLHFDDEMLFALLEKDVNFQEIISLIILILRQAKNLEKYGKDIEELKCFDCGDPFDPKEAKCDKCGSTRPNCIVCLLDLQPSEEESVMKLPCCGAYAHTNHIQSWISKDYRCPNCQKNLAKMLRKMR